MMGDTQPYKAYAGILSVMLGSLLANETLNLNVWVEAFLVAAVAGLAVFLVPNPEK